MRPFVVRRAVQLPLALSESDRTDSSPMESRNQVIITLGESDLLALWQALVDEDACAALAFLKEHILPKIPAKGSAPCDSSRLNPYLRRKSGR